MSGRQWSIAPLVLTMGSLCACGGGGTSMLGSPSNSGGSGNSTQNATPGGIWRGTESVSGQQVVGVVDEAGEFHFIRADNVQYTGTVSTSGTSFSASLEGFAPYGFAFSDNSTHGTGKVSGNIQARASLDGNTQFTTDAGSTSTGTLTLKFDSLYNRASSLTTISGNFSNSADGTVVTVSADGAVFSQNPSTGCVVNGTVSIINATYDVYRVQLSNSNCQGQYAALNGVQFTGLAVLDNTETPEVAIVGVTGSSVSANTKYALVFRLNRT